jgi:hypothetical protein
MMIINEIERMLKEVLLVNVTEKHANTATLLK